MLLSDRDILAEIGAGRIVMDPWAPEMMQPSSIDVRLDRFFRVFENHRYPHIDPAADQSDLTRVVEPEGEEPVHLHPGEFVLGSTYEVCTLPRPGRRCRPAAPDLYVDPRTNSRRCRMKGSSPSGSTIRVQSDWSQRGRCAGQWFSKPEEAVETYVDRRRCIIAGFDGSITIRPASISARMLWSLSSTVARYRVHRGPYISGTYAANSFLSKPNV